MSRIANKFSIKRITSDLIEIIPGLKSIDTKIYQGEKRVQYQGIIKLRCEKTANEFRKEGKLIHCFGTPGGYDSGIAYFEPLMLEKTEDNEIKIYSKSIMVELGHYMVTGLINQDVSWLYEPVLTQKILNSFGDISRDNGYVYLIKSDFGYKIGCSKSPKKRYNIFNVKLPFEISMIRTVNVKDYKNTEKIMQDYFYEKHRNGEWYDLTNEDIIIFDKIIENYTIK